MIIEDNFLDKQSFSNLKSLILDTEFPWRLRKQMTDDDNNYYFSYSFFNNNTINSPHYEGHILPILNKLKCNAVVEGPLTAAILVAVDKSLTSDQEEPFHNSTFAI